MGYVYEAVDYNDPLSLMLQAEGEDTDDRESFFEAGSHRRATSERERDTGDMLGASPYELGACQDSLH